MISIVMTYFNRKNQLMMTLNSIRRSKIKDYEIIIVDDCSDDEHKLDGVFLDEFNDIDIKLIEMDSNNKWYKNPCIPFNKGIEYASGDITILQNPECMHFNDILSEVNEKLDVNEYISFPTYSLSKNKTDELMKINSVDNFYNKAIECISPIINTSYNDITHEGWYNHSIIKPTFYHFCSAIYTKHLKEMGGFDERYADGISYDDDELVIRLKRKGLKMSIPLTPIVLHLYHEKFLFNKENFMQYVYKNEALLEVTKNESGWKVNEKN